VGEGSRGLKISGVGVKGSIKISGCCSATGPHPAVGITISRQTKRTNVLNGIFISTSQTPDKDF
jgi:hypothetical protein